MAVRVTWVVVAEPERAVFYGITRGMARLRPIGALEAPVGGNPGGRQDAFTAALGRHLEEARRDGRLDALVLVASAALMVPLRACLSRPLRAALVAEIDRSRVVDDRDALQAEVLRIL